MTSLVQPGPSSAPPQFQTHCGLHKEIFIQFTAPMTNSTKVSFLRLRAWLAEHKPEGTRGGTQEWRDTLSDEALKEYRDVLKQENFPENRALLRRIPQDPESSLWGMVTNEEVRMFVVRIGGSSSMKEQLSDGRDVDFGPVEEGKTFIIPQKRRIWLPRDMDVIWNK